MKNIELFWSSGILTGSQTNAMTSATRKLFWSSGILTGSQTELNSCSNEERHSYIQKIINKFMSMKGLKE